MQIEQDQRHYKQEEYQIQYHSYKNHIIKDLIFTKNIQEFISIINKIKNDTDSHHIVFKGLQTLFKYSKISKFMQSFTNHICKIINQIQNENRYFQSEKNKNILWFIQKIYTECKQCKYFEPITKNITELFRNITNFDDFILLLKTNIKITWKTKKCFIKCQKQLNDLFYERQQQLSQSTQLLKFTETFKNLSQQEKLIIKTNLIHLFSYENSKYKISQNQIKPILQILNEKPYKKLLETLVQNKFKSIKQFRTLILKSKIQVVFGQLKYIYGSKIRLCNQLKNKETFDLVAKYSEGIQIVPEINSESIIIQEGIIYSKWSDEVLNLAKDKAGYDDTQQRIAEVFINILGFTKKVFDHKQNKLYYSAQNNKILAQNQPSRQESYFLSAFQLIVKFMTLNSLQINHRHHNLTQILHVSFLQNLLKYIEDLITKQSSNQWKNLTQAIDQLITFSAHLFYRRDFQTITPFTTKFSQSILKILLRNSPFPTKWANLRNYKLVIDRWGETVPQDSEQYRKAIKKFIDAYFNQKVIISSKSSSPVFNPIYPTPASKKIFGSQFLKYIQSFEKIIQKSQTVKISSQMNAIVSKIILFMSARLRLSQTNKIGQILGNIYKKYAHIVPDIYIFRAWIMQINASRVSSNSDLPEKIANAMSIFNQISQKIKNFSIRELFSATQQHGAQFLQLLNTYESNHSKILNIFEIKAKKQQYGQIIFKPLVELISSHISLNIILEKILKDFKQLKKDEYQILLQQNLIVKQNSSSVYKIINKITNDLKSIVKYYVCNASKLLSPLDLSILVKNVGIWFSEKVLQNKNSLNLLAYLQSFNQMLGNSKFSKLKFNDYKSHLTKKQILGEMRILNGHDQINLQKQPQIPFNQFYNLYDSFKKQYVQIIRSIINLKQIQSKNQKQDQKFNIEHKIICQTTLQLIICPKINLFGPAYFNDKIQQKVSQQMVFGVFWKQIQATFKQLNVEQMIKLKQLYLLSDLLKITQSKLTKITQSKGNRINQRHFNQRRQQPIHQVTLQMRQFGFSQQQIQLAFQNLQRPDARIAIQWLQNNRDRLDQMILQRTIKKSKEQTMMKSKKQQVKQIGVDTINPINYSELISKIQSILKQSIKGLAKQLFNKKGQIHTLLFIFLDAFKQQFRKKQYTNFMKKTFQQINLLHADEKFDVEKFRLILQIIYESLKKQKNMVKQFYKGSINLKILSFVKCFYKQKQQKQLPQKTKDTATLVQEQIIKIINLTLPNFRKVQNLNKSKQLIKYADCVLDILKLFSQSSYDHWQILHKIVSLNEKSLNIKAISLFEVLSKKNLVQTIISQEQSIGDKNRVKIQRKNDYMISLAQLFIENHEDAYNANIQLEIKGFIINNYRTQIQKIQSTKPQQLKDSLIQIDVKKFSMSFQKFIDDKRFDQVFKKLFTKKKNKKSCIYFDMKKNDLFKSQILNKSFLSFRVEKQYQTILRIFIQRIMNDKLHQYSYFIELHKLIDFFKILIPSILIIKWQNMNFSEWLINKCSQNTKRKYQFQLFLAMNNHLFINSKTSISDYVCAQYLRIFRNSFEEQKISESSILQFIYMLQNNKFNQQCFMKSTQTDISMYELIQKRLINILLDNNPKQYTLLSEAFFILSKREMIDRLSEKYQIIQNKRPSVQNYYTRQFLYMNLIYKADPSLEYTETSVNKRSRPFGRLQIIRHQIEDEMDDSYGMQQIDSQGNQIQIDPLSYIRMRMTDNRRANRQFLSNQSNIQFLPIEEIQQNQIEKQQINEDKQNKIQMEMEKQQKQLLLKEKINYTQKYIRMNEQLTKNINILKGLFQQAVKQLFNSQSKKMQIQQRQQTKKDLLLSFNQQLSHLTQLISNNNSFGSDFKIQQNFKLIEMTIKLILNQDVTRLSRFEKRFQQIITEIIPNIYLNFQNKIDNTKSAHRQQLGRLYARLNMLGQQQQERMMFFENLLNRESLAESGQNRQRAINLNQAIQDIPQEPQPIIVQTKLEEKKVEEKVEKKQEQEVQQKVQQKQQIKINQENKPEEEKPQKMQIQQPVQKVQQKQMMAEQQQNNQVQQIQMQQNQNQQVLIPQQNIQIPQQMPSQIINQPVQNQPYRQILAMFGLSQNFLEQNGIDAESFDQLPEQFQIDQITHYMSQAQNRMAINQLNQSQQQQNNNNNNSNNNNRQNSAQNVQRQSNAQNDILQQNIALFASMDPQSRAQLLADYPPQFLMQLPVNMRAQVEQYRQRQAANRRIGIGSEQMIQQSKGQTKVKKINRSKLKYPLPQQIQFNQIDQKVAKKLIQCVYLRVCKLKTLEGFRILLENKLTQQKALATIIALLKNNNKLNMISVKYQNQEWKQQNTHFDQNQIKNLKLNLINLVLQTLNNQLYKDQKFLIGKIPHQNYLDIKIQPNTQLGADQNGFYPLYELFPFSIDLCPSLTVQILKRTKQIPKCLIKNIVQGMRNDKLNDQIYKNLEFLSKNQDMKVFFTEQFPQQRPLKLQIFAKILKYEFAKVPYLKKLHEQALNFYTPEYNEFLNQIFGVYTVENIKQIEPLLIKHKQTHFKVITYLYSQNRALDKQPMGAILKMPHLIDFQTKKFLFNKHPKIRRASRFRTPIQVSRFNILQESFYQIMSKTSKQLQGRLQIQFLQQQGYDAGGLTREWFLLLSRQIMKPEYALFQLSSSGNTYQPNPNSHVNPDHLQYFKFIGRLVGKALAQNQLLDAYFTRAFYKMILGQQIQFADLEQQDFSFYKSMIWLKENHVEQGDYTFSYLYDNFGQKITKELIPNGKNINVNQQNKLEYIQKYCLAKLRDDFKVQVQSFLSGFHDVIPQECISFFQAKQLQLLISGLPEIDFEDVKNNVDYSGYAPTQQIIKWFWEIVQEFSQEDLARLVQFITGTSKIPVGGFSNLKGMNGMQRISIHKDPNTHQLPKAHTCFNQLDLPNYPNKQILKQKLMTAITWGSEGFGFM